MQFKSTVRPNNSNASKSALKLFFGSLVEISTDQVSYDKENKTFYEEASSLQVDNVPDTFKITNPKTGNFRIFTKVKIMLSDSGEVGGWLYESEDKIKFKLFND